jgi:hypothetical protein
MTADNGAGGLSASDGASGGFHRGKAPETQETEGTKYPRIVFQFLTGLPNYVTTGEAFRKNFVQFMTFAVDPINGGESGVSIASRLNKRVQTRFTDAALVIPGHELIYCRPQRELSSDSEYDADHQRDIYSEGCIIEIWTAKV